MQVSKILYPKIIRLKFPEIIPVPGSILPRKHCHHTSPILSEEMRIPEYLSHVFLFPSSQNHGSEKNGCISNISFLSSFSFRKISPLNHDHGRKGNCYLRDPFLRRKKKTSDIRDLLRNLKLIIIFLSLAHTKSVRPSIYGCCPPKIGVDIPPKSAILMGFSIINHPFWGFSAYFWKHPYAFMFPGLGELGVTKNRSSLPETNIASEIEIGRLTAGF